MKDQNSQRLEHAVMVELLKESYLKLKDQNSHVSFRTCSHHEIVKRILIKIEGSIFTTFRTSNYKIVKRILSKIESVYNMQ